MSILKEIIKPADCQIGFAIPLSRASFIKNRLISKKRDFTKSVLWRNYKKDTIKPSKPILQEYKQLGVCVRKEFDFNDFKLFFESSFKILILFAHWQNDQVEFFNGLISSHDIVPVIPDKDCIIDLNVCTCNPLAEEIAITKKYVIVRYLNNKKALPLVWLHFYQYLLNLIDQKNLTYAEALEQTVKAFYKHFNNENS